MKYQKSMLKIMQGIFCSRKEKTIERTIKDSRTGRNSSYAAVRWLEKNRFIRIKKSGNQRIIIPVFDNYTLQFKYYFDSVEFKTFEPFIKLVVQIFISGIKPKVKAAVLFGSVLKQKKYNDIDILLLGKGLSNNDLKLMKKIRDKTERLFGVIINIHKGELNIDNLFKGVVVYQNSYIDAENMAQKEYFEFVDTCFEAITNPKDKTAFNNSVVNLAYSYCYMNDFMPGAKSDALKFFNKKIKNISELKKTGVKIGKEIFK